jgi:hypothetical protein
MTLSRLRGIVAAQKRKSGDIAHNITVDQLNDLPIPGIGGNHAGSSGVRNSSPEWPGSLVLPA